MSTMYLPCCKCGEEIGSGHRLIRCNKRIWCEECFSKFLFNLHRTQRRKRIALDIVLGVVAALLVTAIMCLILWKAGN